MDRAAYDEIADWYDEAIQSGPQALFHGLVLPVVLDLAGDVAGQRVCDLACGQGVVARLLADRRAEVTGVDVSEKLLDIARRYEQEEPRGISYTSGDAQELAGFEDDSFDGVLCNMALMNIPDLKACLHSVARILRPRGWFVFSITHPCFMPPASRWTTESDEITGRLVAGYFDEGFRLTDGTGVRGKVGVHHHTLSTYMNALLDAGLTMERLDEPQATGQLAEVEPGSREAPPILVARRNNLVPET